MSASNFVIFPSLWCPYLRFPIQLLRNKGRKIIPKKVQKSVKITQTKRVQKKCKTSAEKKGKRKHGQKKCFKKCTKKCLQKREPKKWPKRVHLKVLRIVSYY